MKGIILAGGSGTRLDPLTRVVSKQLLPIYDKPMIHYPLSTLMLAGIRDILIICNPDDVSLFRTLLGDGNDLGVRLDYAEQARPEGIAQALIIARDFVGQDDVALILGDNVFYGQGLGVSLREAVQTNPGATVFGYYVIDPEHYGVAVFDSEDRIIDLEEKPARPKSNWAITGLYLYDNRALDIAAGLGPSARGELEITDLNRDYLQQGDLRLVRLGRGTAWLDTGTPEALLEAGTFIGTVEHRQGLKVACLEEVAWRMGYIDDEALGQLAADRQGKVGDYLSSLLRHGKNAADIM